MSQFVGFLANRCESSGANVLDWSEPFARRVMARLSAYDDRRAKPRNRNTVVPFASPLGQRHGGE